MYTIYIFEVNLKDISRYILFQKIYIFAYMKNMKHFQRIYFLTKDMIFLMYFIYIYISLAYTYFSVRNHLARCENH